MKFLSLFLILTLCLPACDFSKEVNGKEVDCIGITDDADPRYEYKTSGWNIFWGVIFSPSVVIPGVMLFTCVRCPVREKLPERDEVRHGPRGSRVIHEVKTTIESGPGT